MWLHDRYVENEDYAGIIVSIFDSWFMIPASQWSNAFLYLKDCMEITHSTITAAVDDKFKFPLLHIV